MNIESADTFEARDQPERKSLWPASPLPPASPERPRVVQIASRMIVGGVQRVMLETLARTDHERFEQQVVCTKKEGVWGARVRDLGVALYVQKTLPPAHPYQIWRLSRLLRRLRPELVHVHMSQCAIPGVMAARLAGVPHVIVHHHSDYTRYWTEQHPVLRRWELALTRRADRVVAVSAHVGRVSANWLGLPPEAVDVVPNGVDFAAWAEAEPLDLHAEWDLTPGAPVVLCVSRYLETKRIEDFLDAAAVVAKRWPADRPAPAFLVVGDGPTHLRERYAAHARRAREQVRETGSELCLLLVGEGDDAPRLTAAADLAVVPTENEGFCLVALEAMAAGLAIAASGIPPIRELVDDGREALLHDTGDIDALAANIERLLIDREFAARLGAAAQARARRYDWLHVTHGLEDLYVQALNRTPRVGKGER